MDFQLLAQRFEDYQRHVKGYSFQTIYRYRRLLNAFRKAKNIERIEDVTEETVRTYLMDGRVARKWSARTLILFQMTMKVFFRWCVSNGHMSSDPVGDMEMPKVEKRIPDKLTQADSQKLLETAYNYPYEYPYLKYRNHAIFSMFILAGLRRGELLNLKYADVDIDNLTIFVRQGKGAKDRMIPMSFTLAESLRKYVAERKRLQKTCAEFFVSLQRNVGLTPRGLRSLARNIQWASGIKFSIHKLRHTFATLMLEGGCDIYSLSRMMGHSDIKTTTIYLSASVQHLRSQVSKHPLNDLVRYA
ncbi:MAG: tyrosine-type recombinase/integrase [Bacteroidetes bacterium]|nr:tyrosine-type recombinase/integrase [Bacteroidota bacterium]